MKGPQLAAAVGSSAGFVSQVVAPLVRAGWVASDPGPSGGYSLRVDLGDVSVLDVIESIEGPTDSGRCVLAEGPCDASGTCALHVPWNAARCPTARTTRIDLHRRGDRVVERAGGVVTARPSTAGRPWSPDPGSDRVPVSAAATDAVTTNDTVRPRALWRSIALPAEHGGWGLTAEPVVLGLAVAFSPAGLAMGLAALMAFVARTPVKVVLVDRWRHRRSERSRLAGRIAVVEVTIVVILLAVAAVNAPHRSWIPLIVASPLIGLELWYDMRSRGRRLVPELAGTIGIGSFAAAIALAGDAATATAVGLWCVVAARAVAAIPFVRVELKRAKDHPAERWHSDAAQLTAIAIVTAGWFARWVPIAAVVAIGLLALLHVIAVRRAPRPATTIGIVETIAGLTVVMTTALAVGTG